MPAGSRFMMAAAARRSSRINSRLHTLHKSQHDEPHTTVRLIAEQTPLLGCARDAAQAVTRSYSMSDMLSSVCCGGSHASAQSCIKHAHPRARVRARACGSTSVPSAASCIVPLRSSASRGVPWNIFTWALDKSNTLPTLSSSAAVSVASGASGGREAGRVPREQCSRTRTLRVARREHHRGCGVRHQGLDDERAATVWARNAHRRLDLNHLRRRA